MGSWQKTQSEMKIFAKFLLSCVAMLYVATSVSAQDIIVMNNDNADELQVKVVEVLDDVVKYKKWTYQDGPTFSISTTDIFVIKYQNGEKQRFEQNNKKKSLLTKKVADTNLQNAKSSDAETTNISNTPFPAGQKKVDFDIAYYFPDKSPGTSAFAMSFDLTGGMYIVNNLYAEGGLGVFSSSSKSGSGSYKTDFSSTSLSIPLNVGYTLPVIQNLNLDFNTGPRLNYCVAGKMKLGDTETKLKDMEDFDRFSANWGFTFGVDLWGFTVGAKYAIGLSDGAGDMWGVFIGWSMEM